MTREQFDQLFSAYLAGACSKTQLEELLTFIESTENKEWIAGRINQQLTADEQLAFRPGEDVDLEALQRRLDQRLQHIFKRLENSSHGTLDKDLKSANSAPDSQMLKIWWAAAATVLLSAGIFWWNRPSQSNQAPAATQTAGIAVDFKPGTNAAILTVEGGRQVSLNSSSSGMIIHQGNTAIVAGNGRISYNTSNPAHSNIYNTLATSNGNQYSLVLPDGTRVWLNAASSIRYPVAFNGATREVEVKGELYFEVKHNNKQPFIVKAGGQIIEDLGTSFNVHAYTNEPAFSTTLIEGVVKVAGTVLQPGTQAVIKSGKLSIRQADTSQVLAWKNGLFAFHQTPVSEVLRQVARWYDLEVRYQGPIPDMQFGGKISRHSNASAVFTILKKSGLQFDIEGRKLIVTGSSQP